MSFVLVLGGLNCFAAMPNVARIFLFGFSFLLRTNDSHAISNKFRIKKNQVEKRNGFNDFLLAVLSETGRRPEIIRVMETDVQNANVCICVCVFVCGCVCMDVCNVFCFLIILFSCHKLKIIILILYFLIWNFRCNRETFEIVI